MPHHRRLEARVHEAVLAARVLTRLPVAPVDARPEVLPARVVCAVDEVAGALPSLRRARRVAPRRARIVAPAGGELEEERRRGDPVPLGQLEHAFELAVRLLAIEEMV